MKKVLAFALAMAMGMSLFADDMSFDLKHKGGFGGKGGSVYGLFSTLGLTTEQTNQISTIKAESASARLVEATAQQAQLTALAEVKLAGFKNAFANGAFDKSAYSAAELQYTKDATALKLANAEARIAAKASETEQIFALLTDTQKTSLTTQIQALTTATSTLGTSRGNKGWR